MGKEQQLLGHLCAGANVAVIVMVGSVCPITLGHIHCFVEARKIMLGQVLGLEVQRPARLKHFDACLGLLFLNGDGHVRYKMLGKKAGEDLFLDLSERRQLAGIAMAEYDWLDHAPVSCDRSDAWWQGLQERWPNVHFTRFDLNGADDVILHSKWNWATYDRPLITMKRPGYTEQLRQGIESAWPRIDLEEGLFVLGPELPDISSSRVRTLLGRVFTGICSAQCRENLTSMVHPQVADWCFNKWASIINQQPHWEEGGAAASSHEPSRPEWQGWQGWQGWRGGPR